LLDLGERRASSLDPDSDEPPQVRRLFFYQRNTERAVEDPASLPDEISTVLEEELCASFPTLAAYATRLDDDDHDHDHDHSHDHNKDDADTDH
jgi:hypothetical protein